MDGTGNIEDEVTALSAGKAFADISDYWVFEVTGTDSAGWLNDLVTAGVTRLKPGGSTGSLLLDPTGHIRAHFQVMRTVDGFVLLQDPRQPDPVGKLLERYVLSSDVTITDRTRELAIFSVPSSIDVSFAEWTAEPSACIRVDIAVPRVRREEVAELLAERWAPAGDDALERFRIANGRPRFPVDISQKSIPAEAGWESLLVDREKGCFLGQESVARVANLGHPPNVVLGLWTEDEVQVGHPMFEGGEAVGSVTSAAREGRVTKVIARVRWSDRERKLQTPKGHDFNLTNVIG